MSASGDFTAQNLHVAVSQGADERLLRFIIQNNADICKIVTYLLNYRLWRVLGAKHIVDEAQNMRLAGL